jgi:hypothetical protein
LLLPCSHSRRLHWLVKIVLVNCTGTTIIVSNITGNAVLMGLGFILTTTTVTVMRTGQSVIGTLNWTGMLRR